MVNLRLYAIHEFDPLAAESVVQDADVIASPAPLHRSSRTYQLDLHGFVRGPLSVGEACCTDSARVRLPTDGTSYVISFPVRGVVHAVQRGHELDLAPGRAVVSQPPAEVVMTAGDEFDVIVVRVDATALEDALEAQLGYPVHRPLPLAPTLDFSTAAGRGWAALVRYVAHAAVPGGLLTNPMIAEPLQDSLLDGLLRTIDHPYREALDAPVGSWGPGTVRRGVDTMEVIIK